MNEMQVRKGLHITHNDSDAVGCAVVAYYLGDIIWKDVFCKVNEADIALEREFVSLENNDYQALIISDICISESMADYLNDYRRKHPDFMIYLIDHHISNTLNPYVYPWVNVRVHDKNGILTSAALNMLDLFEDKLVLLPNERQALRAAINSISRYDTWEWKKHPKNLDENEFKIITDLLGCEEARELIKKNIQSKDGRDKGIYQWGEFSRKLINLYNKNEKQFVEDTLNTPVITDINLMGHTYKSGIVLCDRTFGNAQMCTMYENFDEVEIVIGLYTADHCISLRTNKNINVSEIAKFYGGGGHASAAGFKAPIDYFAKMMSIYYTERDKR